MTKNILNNPSPLSTRFPNPGAANTGQYQEQGPAPQALPPAPKPAPPRQPTQDRTREEYQSNPNGLATDPRAETVPASGKVKRDRGQSGDDQDNVAMTPDEAINAFGRRS